MKTLLNQQGCLSNLSKAHLQRLRAWMEREQPPCPPRTLQARANPQETERKAQGWEKPLKFIVRRTERPREDPKQKGEMWRGQRGIRLPHGDQASPGAATQVATPEPCKAVPLWSFTFCLAATLAAGRQGCLPRPWLQVLKCGPEIHLTPRKCRGTALREHKRISSTRHRPFLPCLADSFVIIHWLPHSIRTAGPCSALPNYEWVCSLRARGWIPQVIATLIPTLPSSAQVHLSTPGQYSSWKPYRLTVTTVALEKLPLLPSVLPWTSPQSACSPLLQSRPQSHPNGPLGPVSFPRAAGF